MSAMNPRRDFLIPVRRNAAADSARMKPVPIGGGGRNLSDILDLPLGDLVYDAKKDVLNLNVPTYDDAAPITEKTRLKINRGKTKTSAKIVSDKGESFLNTPVTIKRSLKWKAWGIAAAALLGGTAIVDKLTGGEVVLHTVDAAVATADFVYRHTKPRVNVEEAIEWGVALSKPLKFLHTDTDGVLAKNEAAIEVKHRFPNDNSKVRENILPVLFTVDSKSFLMNYGLRNVIAIRNYPDMTRKERGLVLARGLLKDIHESHDAAAEIKTIPMSDNDILHILAKRQDIVGKLPVTLRLGLNTMIADMLNTERGAKQEAQRHADPKPLEDWQIASLKAELSPMPTQEEQRASDANMARAMAEAAEANRPKTLGELIEEQNKRSATQAPIQTSPHKAVENISGKMRAAAQVTAEATPSPARVVWCDLKASATGASVPKCLLGQ